MASDESDKSITRSFKLLSAFYEGCNTKNDLSRLAKNTEINWKKPEIEEDLTKMSIAISNDQSFFFQYWSSWRIPLRKITQEQVAINYSVLMLIDWVRKGRPDKTSTDSYKKFIKNARILFDRSIYEYANTNWKAASDTRLKNNIIRVKKEEPDIVWEPVDNEKWSILLIEAIDKGSISGFKYSDNPEKIDSRIKALLFYTNVLRKVSAPNDPSYKGEVDIDHIIPKSPIMKMKKAESGYDFATGHVSNMFNLEVLPRLQNKIKNDDPLTAITERGFIRYLEDYSYIDKKDFTHYCAPKDMLDLKNYRGELIKKEFDESRLNTLLAE